MIHCSSAVDEIQQLARAQLLFNVSHYHYEQGHYLERIYGTKLDSTAPCLQYYGDIATTPGRLLAFPNVL